MDSTPILPESIDVSLAEEAKTHTKQKKPRGTKKPVSEKKTVDKPKASKTKKPKTYLLDSFNELNSALVLEEINKHAGKIQIADGPEESAFCNSSHTLVMKVKSRKDIQTAVELTSAMKDNKCDEIGVKQTDKGVFLKFKWN